MEQEILWNLEDQIKPEHTALLVIDPQNDFCSSTGAFVKLMGCDPGRIQKAVPRLNRLIEWAREAQLLIIWTRSIVDHARSKTNYKARGFMKKARDMGIQLVNEQEDGSDWYSEVVKPREDETVITKYHYDAFEDTGLDLLLKGQSIRTLLFTGFTTTVCVETTARHGYIKGYYVIVASDCTETITKNEYDASIVNINTYFGKTATSDEIMAL